MKKNTLTKVLLLFVMVALMFSLAACGGNSGSSGSGSKSKTTEVKQLDAPALTGPDANGVVSWKKMSNVKEFEYVITSGSTTVKEDKISGTEKNPKVTLEAGQTVKVRAISSSKSYTDSEWAEKTYSAAGSAAALVNLVRGLESFVNTLNATQAGDTLSADISVGGFFEGEKRNTISLAAKANANKSNPSFLIDFMINDKAYVTLGFKDNKIYVREPINFINSDEEEPEAFYMDVAALDSSVDSLMTFVMNKVGGLTFDISDLTDGVAKLLEGTLGKAITNLLVIKDNGGSKEIGITVNVLKTAISMLPTLLTGVNVEEEVDKYIGYANKGLTAFGYDELAYNGEKINWNYIKNAINTAQNKIKSELAAAGVDEDNVKQSLLKVVANYNNNVLSGLDIVLDLSVLRIEGLDYSAGLNIGLDKFSNSSTVSINPGSAFAKKDLAISLSGALPVKELEANVKGVVRLSDAFANKNNKWATVVATTNNETSTAYIDANGAYVDFSGLFTLFGIDATAYEAKYKAEYKNGAGAKINLVDEINAAAARINEPKAAAPRTWDEYTFDMDEIIDGFTAASDKVEYACNYVYNHFLTIIDETVNEKANAGQADIISWLFNYKLGDTNSKAADYALFYNNATTFEGLGNNIKACHENGKAALDAATITSDNTAGIQLIKEGINNDLLDYLAYFVKIPTISNGEPDFQTLVEPNNAAALKAWLNWIFPTQKKDGEDNDARLIVDDILGMGLDEVIDDGLYFEAINDGGLAGTVRAAASSEANAQGYVTIGAGIAMENSAADNTAAISTLTNFTDKNEGDKYVIAEAGKAMLDGLRAYNK